MGIKQKYDGNISICNREDLMCQGIFMNKQLISENCDCIHSNTCKAIINLLNNNKLKEAEEMANNEFITNQI